MLPIYYFEKASLLDYPNKISIVVFLYGCNLRCPYCHNPELVIEKYDVSKVISEKQVLNFLRKRQGKLDGVVITGGEPLLHKELLDFVKKIKKLGFLVKLDSNGLLPSTLNKFIKSGYIDYVAMDVKYPLVGYLKETDRKNIEKSIDILRNSDVEYEFRTTYVKGIHNNDSVEEICKMINGAKRYFIQNFREGKSIDSSLNSENSFTQKELKEFKKIAKKYIKDVQIR